MSSLSVPATRDGRPRAAAQATDWLAGLPATGGLDEWRGPDRGLSPSWQRLLQTLPGRAQPLAAELQRRAVQLAQQLRADAVAHNVHDTGAAQPWTPELLPLVVEPADWAAIERGVAQRARLLEQVLADAYGPQRLLQRGLLPPALLFEHPGYLRPLHGLQPPLGRFLHVAAFDLARGPDGRWWVTAQHTRTPAGLGHLLHHRIAVSRRFPEAYEQLQVQHVASAYRRLLESLRAQARAASELPHPRLVLLTPGPAAPGYFEHAYLARYLGITLVEGGDLTVRGERLYLKMLEGLAPVHGLLRAVEDTQCDPLELDAHSPCGVPGLLQVVRAGNLALANAPGSGFLESPALMGFLPAIAQALLGQPLLLPTLASWWCGEAAAWSSVRAQLPRMCMRPSFVPNAGALRPDAGRIDAEPAAWTVQERPGRSQALCWRDGKLQGVPVGLRVYALADGPGWQVLPGALARVVEDADAPLAREGGRALDLWVRTDGAVDTFSMLPRRLGVEDVLARRGPVPSRTAESLYWLGRYTERSEQLVRLARAALQRSATELALPVQRALRTLLQRAGLLPEGAPPRAGSYRRMLLGSLAAEQGSGLGFHLEALSRAAGTLRERLSPEQWGLLRRMGEELRAALRPDAQVPPTPAVALRALDVLALQLAAITGAQSDRMTRDQGWRLLTVGRFVERLVSHATQLAVLLAEPGALEDPEGSALLLELFDSTITFRARYQRHHELLALTDLLVLDDTNPRACACILRRLRTELRKLPVDAPSAEALLAALPAQGPGLALQELCDLDDDALRRRLLALATQLAQAGARLSDELGQRFFAHVGDPLLKP